MRLFFYKAKLYASDEGEHNYKKVSGVLTSNRTLTKEDVRQHLIKTTGWDDAHNVKINEATFIP